MALRLAGLGLLCLGCTSGQIGGEVGIHNYPTDESFAACEVVSEVPVAADDPGLAFDLAATIEAVNGTRAVETLTWGEGLPANVDITPEAGRGSIEIEIEAIEGSAFSVERQALMGIEPAQTGGLGGTANQDTGLVCPALLAFEARITVTTDNEALAGTFHATFVAQSPYLVTAAFEVVPGRNGSEFELDASEFELDTARFELAWADGRLSGYLSASVTSDEAAGTFPLAHFPSDGCLEGHDLSTESALVEKAEAFVSGLDHFTLEWPDSTSTELSLTPDFGPACLSGASPVAVLLPMACTAESTDGGIDGLWDLMAVVGFDDGGDVAWTEISRADFAVSAAGEFALDTGITGIAVDPESAATYGFQLSDQLDDEPAEGMLTVLESDSAVCEAVPEEPTSDGDVAPGCNGEQLTEVGSATLTFSD